MGEPLTPLPLVGERLVRLRRRKGVTQETAADAVGISRSYLSRLEHEQERDVSMRVAGQIAAYYDTSIDYLVGRTDKETLDPEIVGTPDIRVWQPVSGVP